MNHLVLKARNGWVNVYPALYPKPKRFFQFLYAGGFCCCWGLSPCLLKHTRHKEGRLFVSATGCVDKPYSIFARKLSGSRARDRCSEEGKRLPHTSSRTTSTEGPEGLRKRSGKITYLCAVR